MTSSNVKPHEGICAAAGYMKKENWSFTITSFTNVNNPKALAINNKFTIYLKGCNQMILRGF
jgi:hypothetical protein